MYANSGTQKKGKYVTSTHICQYVATWHNQSSMKCISQGRKRCDQPYGFISHIFISVNNGAPTLVYGFCDHRREEYVGIKATEKVKVPGNWHFSEVVGIFSPSWVTAKCDYLSCAGKVQPLHKPVFIRCCLLWWCFADVLDHTLLCSLSPAFCHPLTHFGCDTLDLHCSSIWSCPAVMGDVLRFFDFAKDMNYLTWHLQATQQWNFKVFSMWKISWSRRADNMFCISDELENIFFS